MKKFSFLFIAAVMAVSANAQSAIAGLGNFGIYDLSTETWKGEGWAGGTPVNQQVTIAVQVTDADALAWLAIHEGRTVALASFRTFIDGETQQAHIRLVPITGLANFYGVNLVVSQVLNEVDFASANLTNPEDGNTHIHIQLTGASNIGEIPAGQTVPVYEHNKWGYAYFVVETATSPAAPALSWGTTCLPVENQTIAGIARPADACIQSGIEDIFADAAEIDHFEFFNLQGMKLQAEPAEGLFIAVPYLKNGTRGEAKKVLNRR